MGDEKFDIAGWGGETATATAPTDKEGKEESEQEHEQEEQEEQPEQGEPDLGAQKEKENEEDNILSAIGAVADNNFSLNEDEDEPKDEPENGDGKADGKADGKKKITATAESVINDIAKNLEISDAQTTEQLISAIKSRIQAAANGADAPTASIDSALKLPDADLYKAYLVNNDKWDSSDADEYIAKNIDLYGEDWLVTQTKPLRVKLKQAKQAIVDDHIKKQEQRQRLDAEFGNMALEELKGLKTTLGIPLKPYLAELREFQAQLKNPKTIEQMRNDPKSFVEAQFLLRFGKKILNALLKDKGADGYTKGYKASYRTNVEQVLLNKKNGKSPKESPLQGTKTGDFSIAGWNAD